MRAPSMPSGLTRARGKAKKAILTSPDISRLIQEARNDAEHRIYYAFPFLAGTRPSEQLGLLWSEVDFEKGVIRIKRIQERDGSLTELTKTEAGTRDIPMGPALRELLLAWRFRCPERTANCSGCFPGPVGFSRGPSGASEAAARCSTKTSGDDIGSQHSNARGYRTSRRTRRDIRSSQPCRRRTSRSAWSPR
jgi:integrase